jgi:hypothetical protein
MIPDTKLDAAAFGQQPPGDQGSDKPGATGDNDPHTSALLCEESDHPERTEVPPPRRQLLLSA